MNIDWRRSDLDMVVSDLATMSRRCESRQTSSFRITLHDDTKDLPCLERTTFASVHMLVSDGNYLVRGGEYLSSLALRLGPHISCLHISISGSMNSYPI